MKQFDNAYEQAIETLVRIFVENVIFINHSELEVFCNDALENAERQLTEKINLKETKIDNPLDSVYNKINIYVTQQERRNRRVFVELRDVSLALFIKYQRINQIKPLLEVLLKFDIDFYKKVARAKIELKQKGFFINFNHLIRCIFWELLIHELKRDNKATSYLASLSTKAKFIETKNIKKLFGTNNKKGNTILLQEHSIKLIIELLNNSLGNLSDENFKELFLKFNYKIEEENYSFSSFLDYLLTLDKNTIRRLCFDNYLNEMFSFRFKHSRIKRLPRPVAREIWPIIEHFFPNDLTALDLENKPKTPLVEELCRRDIERFMPNKGLQLEILE